MLSLEKVEGLIVIDEIQKRPDLFPALRVLADQNKNGKFLILGSASPDLLKQSSETLEGRIGFQFVTPFTLNEVGSWVELMDRGGFPRSYLAEDSMINLRWRHEYIKTFLERDLSSILGHLPSPSAGKLWRMLAHIMVVSSTTVSSVEVSVFRPLQFNDMLKPSNKLLW